MRKKAVLAILYAAFGIAEIPAAALAQRIKRAIAEKAVESIRLPRFMAGEIFTCLVGKKGIIAAVIFYHFCFSPFR